VCLRARIDQSIFFLIGWPPDTGTGTITDISGQLAVCEAAIHDLRALHGCAEALYCEVCAQLRMLSEAVVRSLLFRCTLAVGGRVVSVAGMRETTNALSHLVCLAVALLGAAHQPHVSGAAGTARHLARPRKLATPPSRWRSTCLPPRWVHAATLRSTTAARSLLAKVPALRRAGNGTDCSTLCFFFLAGHCRRSAARCCYAHGIERLR
jgi:hypothetical protein